MKAKTELKGETVTVTVATLVKGGFSTVVTPEGETIAVHSDRLEFERWRFASNKSRSISYKRLTDGKCLNVTYYSGVLEAEIEIRDIALMDEPIIELEEMTENEFYQHMAKAQKAIEEALKA